MLLRCSTIVVSKIKSKNKIKISVSIRKFTNLVCAVVVKKKNNLHAMDSSQSRKNVKTLQEIAEKCKRSKKSKSASYVNSLILCEYVECSMMIESKSTIGIICINLVHLLICADLFFFVLSNVGRIKKSTFKKNKNTLL